MGHYKLEQLWNKLHFCLLDLLIPTFNVTPSFLLIFLLSPFRCDTGLARYLMRRTEKRDQRWTRRTKSNDFVRSLNNNVLEIFRHLFIFLKNCFMIDEELYESTVRHNYFSSFLVWKNNSKDYFNTKYKIHFKESKWDLDGIKHNLGDSHFTVDSSERILEKIFQTTSRDGCVWYNRRRTFYFCSFFLIHSLPQILKYREKREDCLIKLNRSMTLNNDRIKFSSTDRYESFGATVGDLCFVSRSIIGHILDLSSRNVSNVVTQWNTSVASLPIWLLSLTNVW